MPANKKFDNALYSSYASKMYEGLAVFLAITIFLYHHITKNNNYWKVRNIPGPEPNFLFGNTKDIALRRKYTGDVYKEICDQYPDEKLVGIFQMRSPDLIVKDLEIVKHILVKDYDVFTDRDIDIPEEGLGANLFAANGDTWRALRNHFSPIFTTGKLKSMLPLILECGEKLVEFTEKIIRNQPNQEVHGIISRYTQASIAACAFGLDMDTFNMHNDILEKLEPKIFVDSYRHELDMMYPGILKRLNLSLLPKEVTGFFHRLTKYVIAERNGIPTDRNDIVDLMLGMRKEKRISTIKKEANDTDTAIDMTDNIMAGQMFIFYSAGYQNSALTMSYMLYYLAKHPHIQDKVVAEIEEVLQRHGEELNYEAIFELKYLAKVFHETTRLHPVADAVRRRATTDYKVPGTNLTVNKGQIFIIPVPVVHMNKNIYANPEEFDPERFAPENVAQRHSCSYLSFGKGPRHCIGMRFHHLVSRVGAAKLLSKFRVETTAATPRRFRYDCRIVMQPLGGFPLRLVKRY